MNHLLRAVEDSSGSETQLSGAIQPASNTALCGHCTGSTAVPVGELLCKLSLQFPLEQHVRIGVVSRSRSRSRSNCPQQPYQNTIAMEISLAKQKTWRISGFMYM